MVDTHPPQASWATWSGQPSATSEADITAALDCLDSIYRDSHNSAFLPHQANPATPLYQPFSYYTPEQLLLPQLSAAAQLPSLGTQDLLSVLGQPAAAAPPPSQDHSYPRPLSPASASLRLLSQHPPASSSTSSDQLSSIDSLQSLDQLLSINIPTASDPPADDIDPGGPEDLISPVAGQGDGPAPPPDLKAAPALPLPPPPAPVSYLNYGQQQQQPYPYSAAFPSFYYQSQHNGVPMYTVPGSSAPAPTDPIQGIKVSPIEISSHLLS